MKLSHPLIFFTTYKYSVPVPQFDTTGKVYNLSPMGNKPEKKLYYTTGTSWGGTEVEYSFGFAKHHIQFS